MNRIDSEGEFWKELKEIGKSFCEAGIAVVMVATAVAAVGGAITGTIMSGGAAAGTVPLALTLAVECLGVAGVATAAVGATAAAVAEAGESVVEFSKKSKNNKNSYDPNPYKRPGQKSRDVNQERRKEQRIGHQTQTKSHLLRKSILPEEITESTSECYVFMGQNRLDRILR